MNEYPTPPPAQKPSVDIGFLLIGFFLPIAGLILYFVYKESDPGRARSAGIGALVTTIISLASVLLAVVIMVVMLIIAGGIVGIAI